MLQLEDLKLGDLTVRRIVLYHCRHAGEETGRFWGIISCALKDKVSATWASFPVCLCIKMYFSKKGLQGAVCPLELPAEFMMDSEISLGSGQLKTF